MSRTTPKPTGGFRRRAVRAAAAVLCLLSGLCVSIPARAQSEVIPKEVQDLFSDIADIDKLRVLNPLKLTGDQLDKLIATLKKAQDNYNAKLAEAAVPPIRQIARDIKETRRTMLATHGTVPKDFDDKVKKMQDEFLKRRNDEDKATLKSLSDSIKAILTKDQFGTAVSLSKKFAEHEGKELKGSDDQFFNLYVLGTFVVYPRIVPLLQDMRKSAESAAGSPAPNRGTKVALGGRTR